MGSNGGYIAYWSPIAIPIVLPNILKMKSKLLFRFMLTDPIGNKAVLAVSLREDSTLAYCFHGSWQPSGTPYSLSNLQFGRTLPVNPGVFKKTDSLLEYLKGVVRSGVYTIHRVEVINELHGKNITYAQMKKKYPELNWKEAEEIDNDDLRAASDLFDRLFKK